MPGAWIVSADQQDGDSFVRVVEAAGVVDAVGELLRGAAARENAHGAVGCAVRRVTLQEYCFDQLPAAKDVYVTNVSGKVTHSLTDSRFVLRPEVQPYVQRVSNSFGFFLALFSPFGNVYTTQEQTFSFFRGGSSSAGVAELLRHAFGRDSVERVDLHVVVLSWNVGRPVRVGNAALGRALRAGGAWEVGAVVCDEHGHTASVRLVPVRVKQEDEDEGKKADAGEHADPRAGVKHVLLSVSHTGGANAFVSVREDVPWRVGVEHEFVKVAQALREVVQACS